MTAANDLREMMAVWNATKAEAIRLNPNATAAQIDAAVRNHMNKLLGLAA